MNIQVFAVLMSLTVGGSAMAQGASDSGGRGKSRFDEAIAIVPASRIPGGLKAETIVLHMLGGKLDSAVASMKSIASGKSCHYLVGRDGSAVQMVRERDAAIHARGANLNSYCVSFEGRLGEPLTDKQIAVGREIVQGIEKDRGIAKVITHQDVAQSLDCGVSDEQFKAIVAE